MKNGNEKWKMEIENKKSYLFHLLSSPIIELSLMAQRDHRIDLCRSSRRQIPSE